MANEKVDVVIVGAGPSGILMAAKLATAGKKVIVLEQGPAFQMKDLISSDIWARRLKWGGPRFASEGGTPILFNFNVGWGVGGAALHHYANWPRLHAEDFRMKSLYGHGLDWPISYDDVRPYYDRIQTEVGLSGDHKAEIWRPAGAPYPMPPVKTFRHGEVVAEGFRKMGMHVSPAPVAINSVDYNGRPACIYDGWCNAGCPIGALVNPQATYLPVAVKAGADVRAESYVTRVLTNARGDRATGVEYYDRQKQKQVQQADVVILAAFSAANPRILFNSKTDKHPNGLANSSGLVGHYMMAHHLSATWGMFDENIENHMGTTAAQFMCQDNYPKNSHKEAFGSITWFIGTAMKPSDLLGFAGGHGDVFGAPLHDFMKQAARGLTRFGAQGEEIPVRENRIELTDEKDEFGFPLARIDHTMDPEAMKLFHFEVSLGHKIMQATAAKEVWSGQTPGFSHLLGGTIMGKTPTDSVVDSYGRTHDVANLFIAGPGNFPTEGAVNPTFTIHALSLRSAEYMTAHWGSIVA